VDVTHWSPAELENVADLRKFTSKIAAVGVDTYDDLEFCKELNFDFYQGQFLFKPASQPKDIPVNRMNMLRLLSRLHDPNIDLASVEQIVSQDVALTYKILQYANSAAVPLPRKVSSAGHAVRLIGLETIKAWSSALLLSSVGKKPRELMTTALVRALT
jgi:EAL and modified HD-GYP domain-containing signal transduction protein